ncbi:DUF4386 domain-containing protein [Actinoplanes regularis]|uniref:DUF4386 domain-containing protein n=1 Tax=Actinoplanes regularis TaxID=52697 RepID=A0A239A3Z3_9ACTN|nr:DUF4386 domain-containing protein [Actinoplanes regularis]GIE87107.1 hypothetical protein Are01nite_35870 [Actinoplanes regularis]SNR90367.1 protein of unknown function [Actinoplanes regularis]
MHTLTRTARMTGLFYLGMAITAALGFLLIRPQIFVADDPSGTLANLVTHGSLARAGVALELAMVVAQAFTAAWFYRLFRTVNSFAAGGIAAFGLVNAVVGLVGAAMLGTAIQVSADPFGDAATTVQVLYLVSYNMWGVGALFFGLWLLPMGWCVLRSGWMPRALGWILVAGGVGYVLSPFVLYLADDAQVLFDAMAYPASVGEFWMIGYLLIRGVRRQALDELPPTVHTPAPLAS